MQTKYIMSAEKSIQNATQNSIAILNTNDKGNNTPAENALMYITNRPNVLFTKGFGMWLYDQNGKAYLDYLQGWAVNCLGHCHPKIVEALQTQAAVLINPSPGFYNQHMLDLAARLVELSDFDKVFFANTGAEANESSIKLARKWGKIHKNGAYEIISFKDAFHGRTLATMNASGKPGFDEIFLPKVPGFVKAEFNNLESVAPLIHEKTVAIMLEPVQGEGGVLPATQAFMDGLVELCNTHNLLLLVDEVQSGCARTGHLFAYQGYNIKPDIMSLGKGIGGGVPLAACLATNKVAVFEAGDQGGTYNGNPLMSAVGLAVIAEISKPEFLQEVLAKGAYLSDKLNQLSSKYHLKGERGRGLLRALIFDADIAADIVAKARDLQPEGLLLNAVRPNILRFMPALNVSYKELDIMLTKLDDLIADIKNK